MMEFRDHDYHFVVYDPHLCAISGELMDCTYKGPSTQTPNDPTLLEKKIQPLRTIPTFIDAGDSIDFGTHRVISYVKDSWMDALRAMCVAEPADQIWWLGCVC